MAADGTWSIPLTLPVAGSYRVFTDVKPEGGQRTTLGADVQVAGQYQPEHYDSPGRTDTVDGYEVQLAGDLVPGRETSVTATVTRARPRCWLRRCASPMASNPSLRWMSCR